MEEDDKITLEEALDKIPEGERRADIVSDMYRYVDVPKRHVHDTIHYFSVTWPKYRSRAIEITEHLDMLEKAIELCDEEGGSYYEKGAKLAKKAGMDEKAREMYAKADDFFYAEGYFASAADCCDELNQPTRAYELRRRALESCEENNHRYLDCLHGARIAMKMDLKEKAKELYARAIRKIERHWTNPGIKGDNNKGTIEEITEEAGFSREEFREICNRLGI
jgi:tetratricopeptide (TPR) repeat protein